MLEKIQRSLANKISLIISLILIIIFAGLALFCYDFANRELMKHTIQNTELEARLISNEVSQIFDNAKIITDQIGIHTEIQKFLNTAQDKKQLPDHPYLPSVKNTLNNIKNTDPYLFTAWVGNEKANFYFDNFGVLPDDTYDVRKRPWYPIAMSTDSVGFTPPYMEWGTGKIVVCAVKALRANGIVYGFSGVEIILDKIPEIFNSHKIGTRDINFLLSEDGKYIYNKDPSKIMTDGIDNPNDPLYPYKNMIYQSSRNLNPITFDGNDYLLLSYPVGESKWRVVSLINKEDIQKSITDALMVIIGIFAFTVFFTLFVINYVVTRSIKPYRVLVDFAKNIADGNFSSNIPNAYIQRKDEMGKMSHSFQLIIDAFRNENALLEEHIKEKDIELESQYKYIIESEKSTSLGNLVAGVAHEINTPLGICVSMASYMDKLNKQLTKQYEAGKITKTALELFLRNNTESLELLNGNVTRAADLVSSFKQVAVDQSVEIKSTFNLKDSISAVIISLKHEYKNKNIEIINACPDDLVINSYSGAYAQIFTNLIMNSLNHGFCDLDHGKIEITVENLSDKIILSYKDDGNGISEENLLKIYDPFFTTKRGNGNSGLGMHILFNIVNQLLKGRLQCTSTLGQGVVFTFDLPKEF